MPTMPQPSRRALNTMLLATAASSFVGQRNAVAEGAGPVPFRVDIPQATIDRILSRVREAQWPDRLDATDWRYGANWDYMKALSEYWIKQFDWRKAEANLNRYPQFLARVGDYDIHFYHVTGRGPKPMPLILTHGWPGSVFEFLDAIGPLSDPASYGGSPDDAFDVVVPLSLSETQTRTYWWCRPPRMGIESTRPVLETSRGTGASLRSDRCVRTSL